jgi:hypothetical protein
MTGTNSSVCETDEIDTGPAKTYGVQGDPHGGVVAGAVIETPSPDELARAAGHTPKPAKRMRRPNLRVVR